MTTSLLLAALPLWFCLDFDAPAELGGELFEQTPRLGESAEGRFGKGYAFTSDKPRGENDFYHISDPELLKSFPHADGAFACWFKSVDPEQPLKPAFAFGGFWQFQWGWDGTSFHTAQKGSGVGFPLKPSATWRHFAVTWNADALVAYVDGQVVAEKAKPVLTDMRDVARATLRFGVGGDGRPASGLVMDDIAVFSRALTAEEVGGIAAGKAPLRNPDRVSLQPHDHFKGLPPPADPNAFQFLSWGGNGDAPMDFLKRCGINTVNVPADSLPQARRAVKAGLFVNVRLENAGSWRKGSKKEIAERARVLLRPYQGLANWRSTLVNSEVYGARTAYAASSNVAWRAHAEKALGFAPDFRFGWAPAALDYKALGVPPFKGVLPTDCAALETLSWFQAKGNPVYAVNAVDRSVVREFSPNNVVWSEPSPPAIGLDQLADWIYDYSTARCLYHFVRMSGHASAAGVPFMPTLSASYHHSWEPYGAHPTLKDAKGAPRRVSIAQSVDEMKIKTWMALASIPASALSYFNLPHWVRGEINGKAFLDDPTTNVTVVAEPDASRRYGDFLRQQVLPRLKDLANVPNARARLALLQPIELQYAGNTRWTMYNYSCRIGDVLGSGPVPFDVIADAAIEPETLRHYKYVILPLGNVLTKAHRDALAAVAETTKVIVDSSYALDLPNVEKLKMRLNAYDKQGLELDVPLKAWLAAHRDELRREAFAWSEQDGESAFTFVKEKPDGRRLVVVVNDAREERSLWPTLCSDPKYRPIAAPNRITVHFNLPDGERVETHDFAPAEAKFFEF